MTCVENFLTNASLPLFKVYADPYCSQHVQPLACHPTNYSEIMLTG
jgi:hypothetical protein